MMLCCFLRPRVVDDEPNKEQQLKKGKCFKKEKKKRRKMKGKLEEQLEKQVEVKQTNRNEKKERKEKVEEVAVEEMKAEKEQEMGEKEKNGVEKQLFLKEVSMESVEEMQIDLQRGTEELKDEETSLKEEQVQEPVPGCHDIMDQQKSLDADCSSSDGAPAEKGEKKEAEEMEVKLVEVEKEQEVGEEENNGVQRELLMKQVNKELVEVVKMDLERGTEELKDEEMSLKEEQVQEPVLGFHDIMDQQKSLDADCSSSDGAPAEKGENKEAEEMEVKLVEVEKEQEVGEEENNGVQRELLMKQVNKELVEVVKMDLERGTEELKDEEMSLKEEQVEEPLPADPLDLLLNTSLANAVSKLEDKEEKAISSHLKNSGDALHQDYELLLMKMKKIWARKFSEMSAVRRPLVHSLTSCLHNDAKEYLHLCLNTTVDSILKEEVKQLDMKRKWMERLRQREELKKLSSSTGERQTDVSHTEKSANAMSKLEDKEEKAISSHLKNSSDALHQDYELLLMKMKKIWARKFSEMSAVRRPLVHSLTSCLHNDAKEYLHLGLNTTVDSILKEEVKQLDMKRKWMERLRQREELKKLSGSTGERQTDVSHTEKSANAMSKLEDKEEKAISSHLKNSSDALHQDYELLLMKMKTIWARKFSEMSAVRRPLVHSLTSCLHNDAKEYLHLGLNTTVDSILKEEVKQLDMKRKWMERLRQREELKKLSGSTGERPTDVSHTEKSAVRRPLVHSLTSCLHNDAKEYLHLCLNTTVDSILKEEVKQLDMKRKWMERLRQREELKKLSGSTGERPTDVSHTEKSANAMSKLEDKEEKAISSHFKNSGDAQHQDYELLLMKMKKKWARKFSEMSAVRRPLVHPLTSCLHNDAPVDLHVHLSATVDSTLKEELKQMDMKRKWMERLRQREELKKLSSSTGERPTDVSHTEKSVQSQPVHPPRTTPPNVRSPVKGHKQMSKTHLIKTSNCSQEEAHAKKVRRKQSKRLT
ncbi:hypothetical protein MHYP_G00189180 [Metynnis hypsauchen]